MLGGGAVEVTGCPFQDVLGGGYEVQRVGVGTGVVARGVQGIRYGTTTNHALDTSPACGW